MTKSIAIIGLGYVGLPLAVALARKYETIGFDINIHRIKELQTHLDRTGEIDTDTLKGSTLTITNDTNDLAGKDIYIVTVPTPIDDRNKPDLTAMKAASKLVGAVMQKGAIVVYESTVYPGVTEDICGPILEKESGLVCGQDFFLGYSPERINPGDKTHTVETITKVVAGQNDEITTLLADVYGSINNNNIFRAACIKTAEAAKVIENAQRDINIAFMNEISVIFERLNISTYDVLEAAKTKWNFLPFTPGLVGGHCISVDPYYLAEHARTLGVIPELINAGRRINDAMGKYIASKINDKLSTARAYGKPARILVLGLTFKENVPDLRNTKVIDIVRTLDSFGHQVVVHDIMADKREAHQYFDIEIETDMTSLDMAQQASMAVGERHVTTTAGCEPYDCVIGAVSHDAYKNLDPAQLQSLLKPGGLLVDIKKMWSRQDIPDNMTYWTL